jgi:proline dehydrogenase
LDEQRDSLIRRVVYRLVKKHIAGSTSDSALSLVRELNGKGMHATITYLNEGANDVTRARYNANTYAQIARQIARLNLNASISIRLSQVGLLPNDNALGRCMEDIIKVAKPYGISLWLESEDRISTEELFSIYRKYRAQHKSIGVEIPIWEPLDKSFIRNHIKEGDFIKLVSYSHKKGAAAKPEKAAKKHGADNGNGNGKEASKKNELAVYVSNIGRLLQEGATVYVLEPDEKMVAKLGSFSKEYRRNLIFELPLGYSNRHMARLLKMRIRMGVYIPYGKDWTPYVINKLTEGHMRDLAAAVLYGKRVGAANAKSL